jgi:hypothetical protein
VLLWGSTARGLTAGRVPAVHPRSGTNVGKREEHVRPRVVAAWDGAAPLSDIQPPELPGGWRDVRRLTDLLEQPVRAGFRPPRKAVWHCSIRNYSTDRILTDAQWEHIAAEVIAAVGLAPHGEAQIAEQEAIAAEAGIPPVLRGMVGEHAIERWAEIGDEVARKREIIRTVADIRLLRAGKGVRRQPFGAHRLEWRWLLGPDAGEGDQERAGTDAALAARSGAVRLGGQTPTLGGVGSPGVYGGHAAGPAAPTAERRGCSRRRWPQDFETRVPCPAARLEILPLLQGDCGRTAVRAVVFDVGRSVGAVERIGQAAMCDVASRAADTTGGGKRERGPRDCRSSPAIDFAPTSRIPLLGSLRGWIRCRCRMGLGGVEGAADGAEDLVFGDGFAEDGDSGRQGGPGGE